MKRYLDELTKRVDELIKVYENSIWKDEDKHLIVGFHREKMISFYLYDAGGIVDEMYLSFGEKEEKLYKALCLKTFAILLGNVKVNEFVGEGINIYYNRAIKPYLAVFSDNQEILSMLNTLVDNQENEVIKNNPIIDDVSKKAKRYLPNYNALNELDERIDFSKKMLRGKL